MLETIDLCRVLSVANSTIYVSVYVVTTIRHLVFHDKCYLFGAAYSLKILFTELFLPFAVTGNIHKECFDGPALMVNDIL